MIAEKKKVFPLTTSGLLLVVFCHALLAITSANTAPSYGFHGDVLEAIHALSIALLIGVYALAALRLSKGHILEHRHVWLCLALSAAPYFLNFATQSTDIYNYIAYAEVSQHGSAYLQGPSSLGTENAIIHGIWERWRPFPSPYGPVWTILGNAIGALHASLVTQMLLYKVLGAGVVFGIAQVLFRWSPKAFASIVVLNPIFIVEFIGDAHNDGLFTLAILLAVVSFSRPALSGLATGLSVATKHLSLILSPLFVILHLRVREYRKAFMYVACTTAIILVSYALVWQGTNTFSGVFAVLPQFFAVPMFFPQKIILSTLQVVNPESSLLMNLRMSAAIGLGAYLLVQLWVYWRVFRGRLSLYSAAFLSLCAIILFGMQWVQPWYLTWPLALSAFLQPKYATRAIAIITIVWFASMYTTY